MTPLYPPRYDATVQDGDERTDDRGCVWYARDVDHLNGLVCWSLTPHGRITGSSARPVEDTAAAWARGVPGETP